MKVLVNVILSGIGTCLVTYVLYRLVTNWDSVASGATYAEFAAPIWLTLGVLPFVYCLGILVTYESAFTRVDFAVQDGAARRRLKLALAITLGLNLRDVGSFVGGWVSQAAGASCMRDAKQVLRDFQRWNRRSRSTASPDVPVGW